MAIPFLSNIDLHKKQIIDAALHNKTSAPSAPADGQIYFNSDASVMKAYIYMGSSKGWVDIGGDIDGITAGDGLTGGGTSGALTLNVVGGTGITANANDIAITNTGVTAASYGSATAIPVLTINAQGQVTAASTAAISSTLDIAADSGTDNGVVIGTDTLTVSGTANEIETSVSGDTITVGLPNDVTVAGNLTVSDDIIVTGSTPIIKLTDTDTNADCRIHADSSNGSFFIDADFNNESNPTKIHIKTDGEEVGYFRGDSNQIGSLRLFPEKNDNAAQGIFFGTAASGSNPGVGAFTDVRAISFSSGSKLHLYPGSTTASASVPLAIASDGQIEGTSIKDQDNMSSDSATHLATQQSIKAYVDGQTYDNVSVSNLSAKLALISDNVTIGDATDVQVTIAGDLVVNGTTTTVASTTIAVGDNMYKFAKDNSANSLDIGWYGKIVSSGTKYPVVAYDASTGISTPKFVVGIATTEPGSTVSIATTGTVVANLEGNVTGNLTGTADQVANALTVDNTTIQLNSGTTYNGGAARTISAKTAAIADGGTGLATADQIYDHVTTRLATEQSTNNKSFELDNSASGVASSDNITYTITHGMGASRLYKVEVIEDANNYETVYVEVQRPSDTTIKVIFGAAVTAGAYRALITKI